MSSQKPLSVTAGLFRDPTDTKFNNGLRFVAYKAGRQIFLSSRQNKFGGMRFKRVKVDHGADGLLLYFPTVSDIENLGRKFSDIKFRMTVESGNGIGARFNTLVITHIATKPFAIDLCKDLLPNNKRFPVKKLQFILCKDDVTAIFTDPKLDAIRIKLQQTGSDKKIQELARNVTFKTNRRSHVLLGQAIIEDLSLHEHAKLHIGYDYDFGYTGNYDTLCYAIRDQLLSRDNGGEEAEFLTELTEEPNQDASWEEMLASEDEDHPVQRDSSECDFNADEEPEMYSEEKETRYDDDEDM